MEKSKIIGSNKWARVIGTGNRGRKEGDTNKKFAQENAKFIAACQQAGVEATPRQASKFRNKRGKAFNI